MASTDERPEWPQLAGILRRRFQRLSSDALDNLREVLEQARGLLNCSEAGLLVPSGVPNELRFLVSVNSRPEITASVLGMAVPCDRSLAGYVFTTGLLIARTNPAQAEPGLFYPKVDAATGLVTVHYLVTPIVDDGQTQGVATFMNRPAGAPDEPFGPREIDLSQGIARLLAVGLEYHQQLSLQQAWMQAELDRALAELTAEAGDAAAGPTAGNAPWESSRPAILRALSLMDRLPAEQQELAAELIECLARHLAP